MKINGYEIVLGRKFQRKELHNPGPGGSLCMEHYRRYSVPDIDFKGLLHLNGRTEQSLRNEIYWDIKRCLLKRSGEVIGFGIYA